MGWYADEVLFGDWGNHTDSITLTAKWGPLLTVSFDAAGGSPEPEPQTVHYGETASLPAEPAKDGFTFRYWYLSNYEVPYYFGTAVTAGITLTALWRENIDGLCDVVFDLNGGEWAGGGTDYLSIEDIAEGTLVSAVPGWPDDPVRPEKYIDFFGWNSDPAATPATSDGWFRADTPITETVTLTAIWETFSVKSAMIDMEARTPKTLYNAGEEFDGDGFILDVVYENNVAAEVEVTPGMVTFANTVGRHNLRITYKRRESY
jgi:hypothetical protein